VVAVWI